ncbi:MAG: hypothetical protein GQ565_11620 [Candidatus Aegiribacteria sp.]|nr:hypothetical protein [Candidatus Aegiribacteria sp.]
MVRISIRTKAGFCLLSLLMFSCGSRDDTGSSASPDSDKIIVTDTLPDLTTVGGAEFLMAAHILIAWDISVEASVSGGEEEARRRVYIVSDAEDDALDQIRDIQDEILSGRVTFEEMAFSYSHCTSAADSGRLPDFTGGAITEELDSAISALEPGEISGIIRTRFGYHLVKRLGS